MAQKLAFASGGSSSWADDDDLEPSPLPFAVSLPKVEEQQEPMRSAASPRREQQQPDRRDRKYSSDSHDRDHGHVRREYGGYSDRGGRGDRGDRGDRGSRGGYRDEPREERPKNPVPDQGPYRVFMGNLSFRVNEQDIVDFFGISEAVTDVRVQREPDSDRSRGFAYVEFRDREALVEALKLDGENFDGRAVRLDVATDNRKKSGSSFFEKRGDRSRNDRRGDERNEAPRERQRLTLQPRSAPVQPKDPEAQRKSIFGEAKPRDEAAFWERKKAQEAEAKAKAAAAKEAKKNAPREPRERKASHDDAEARPAGGRGGRGRGERTERAGGRGRGGQAAPVSQSERTPAKKEEAKPKKEEAKTKTVEPKMPKVTKIPAPAATKTKNAFELLNDDSDSD